MPRQKAKALPRPEPEMWTVQGDIVQETEDAILLQVNGADYWLPKSQIEYEGQRDDTEVKVTLPDWLAEDKGLSDGEGVTADAPAASQETPETCTFCGVVLGEDDETNTLHLELTPAGEEAPFSIRIDRARIVGRQPDEDGRESVTLPRAYALELELVQPNSEPAAQDKHFLESETITVVQELTQAEKAAYADEMARLDDQIETLEDERDKENKAKKKQIDALEEERRQLSKLVREGKETREIYCDKCADYDTGEIVWTDAHPPYAEVQRRAMTAEERQLPLLKSPVPSHEEQPAAADPALEDAEDAPTEGEASVCDDEAQAPSTAEENDAPAETVGQDATQAPTEAEADTKKKSRRNKAA